MTKIFIAYELLMAGISKSHIAKHLGVSRRTIIRWAQAIEKHGSLDAFLEEYDQAKKGTRQKRKIDAILKRRIWALRAKHHQCCGQKIQYFLEKEYAQQVSVTTIYKVLSEKYQLRSKWKKNKPRGALPVAQAARQVIHTVPVSFGRWTRCSLELSLPSQLSIFTAKSVMYSCAPHLALRTEKPFWSIVCQDVLMASQR